MTAAGSISLVEAIVNLGLRGVPLDGSIQSDHPVNGGESLYVKEELVQWKQIASSRKIIVE